jgi:hypothetical protein
MGRVHQAGIRGRMNTVQDIHYKGFEALRLRFEGDPCRVPHPQA